ncbi:eIF-2-alpha kinase GCN2-like [Tasmannia lanceolata]|uniref:eIF-2-alpha kinase GCN2-like n=1 Tax=Tasmannia lanceolata TaxID=3420 RepID=UPI004062ECCC
MEPLESRFLQDFQQIEEIGHGAWGVVVLCLHILDGKKYAIKKVPLMEDINLKPKVMREIEIFSSLKHRHVVRYYQAWIEDNLVGYNEKAPISKEKVPIAKDKSSSFEHEFEPKACLYIQMEYCPRTLKQFLGASDFPGRAKLAWHFFGQIIDGLSYIHGCGIVHIDLKPDNILLDAHDDIKIADFGCSMPLTLLQQDVRNRSASLSLNPTIYLSPELKRKANGIDEKVDMYSLGVMFFELFHAYTLDMERCNSLTNLRRGVPLTFAKKHPEAAALISRMMSENASDRPSAIEVQDELLVRRKRQKFNLH